MHDFAPGCFPPLHLKRLKNENNRIIHHYLHETATKIKILKFHLTHLFFFLNTLFKSLFLCLLITCLCLVLDRRHRAQQVFDFI